MTKHVWKRIEEASELTGLSETAIKKSNIITGCPPIKRKADGFLYVEFIDLQFWIKMEGLYELELLVDDENEKFDDADFNN